MEKNKQKSISLESKIEKIYPIPKSWEWVTTNDICSKINDGTHHSPHNTSKGDVPYVTAKNIRPNKIDLSNITYIDKKTHRKIYARCNPKKNDVLYTKDGTVGYSAVNNFDFEFSLLSSVALLKPHKSIIDPYYLSNYLNSPVNFYRTTEKMTGTALRRIILKTIKAIPIPLAPLNEQKRIVAKIEELLSKLENTIMILEKNKLKLKQYRVSLLKSAFNGNLTKKWREENNTKKEIQKKDHLPEGWKWSKIQEITENHDGKRIPVSAKLRKEMKGEYPYYGASGIIDYVNRPLFNGKYLLIGEDGANLLARKTPIAFIVNGEFWVNNHAHVLTTLDGILLEFLSYFINSINLSAWISGTAQPKLNQSNLNKIPIPIPPLNEQIRIVEEIEESFSLIEKINLITSAELLKIQVLKTTILKQAFEGKLVPQDPNDEPASELLKRIKFK